MYELPQRSDEVASLYEHGVRPLLPPHWTDFDLQYRFGASRYDINWRRAEPEAAASVVLDGVEAEGDAITLVDDGRVHTVVVNLGHRPLTNPLARKPDGPRGNSATT